MWLVSLGAYGVSSLMVLWTVLNNKNKKNRIWQLLIFIIIYGLGYLLIDAMKINIGRPRPFSSLSNVILFGYLPTDLSFPSGHTFIAFLTAVLFKKKWLWFFAAAVGFSRIYLGLHYPIDVTFGAIFGIIYGLAVQKLPSELRFKN